jgi:hypothetical protein
VYWHTKVVRKSKPDLFLFPSMTISFDPPCTVVYMGAATLNGFPAQFVVCNEDRSKVRLVSTASCVGVGQPKGTLYDRWVQGAVESFGAQLQKEWEAGFG